MRRYTVSVDGRSFTIDVTETAADRFEVSVGERTFAATLEADEDLPGVAISPEMAPLDDARAAPSRAGPPRAAPGSRVPPSADPASEVDPARPRARPERSELLSAPMPGIVLEVLVATGTVLRRGDPILVLEAMKMRNTIRAPRPATVLEVAVEAGQPVVPGQPMVRLGPAPG